MTGTDNTDIDPRAIVVDEWRSRTTYGKLWFPVWLLSWGVILVLGVFLLGLFTWEKQLDRAVDSVTGLTPETHKRDGTE